jgi:hypothetical protein
VKLHRTFGMFALVIALVLTTDLAARAETITSPRARPDLSSVDRTGKAGSQTELSSCQLRLLELADFKAAPSITGPGECTATDVVTLEAVLLSDKNRVVLSPAAMLRCPMAEAVARWTRDDVAPSLSSESASLRGIETLDSFNCRTFNGVSGARVSEHGRANALDVGALKLADGTTIRLTDAGVSKSLRKKLRDSACEHFSTVLGNGADAYHDTHVHIDLMERSNHYKICQWDVLDPTETAALVAEKAAAAGARESAAMREASDVPLPRSRPVVNTDAVNLSRHNVPPPIFKERTMRTAVALSLAGSLAASALSYAEEQTVTVGPWTIATSYKGDKFDGCSMSRSAADLDITFLRAQDSLLLLLDSQKWKLEHGKAYTVRLVAGSRSVEAKALAENKAVTIALVDRSLNERLRTADILEVRGDGATLRVPLDGSTAALGRLEACFDKNSRSGVETNPFVSPSRKP